MKSQQRLSEPERLKLIDVIVSTDNEKKRPTPADTKEDQLKNMEELIKEGFVFITPNTILIQYFDAWFEGKEKKKQNQQKQQTTPPQNSK